MSSTATRFRAAILALPGGSTLYGSRVFAKVAPPDLAGPVWIVLHQISATREAAHDGDGFLQSVMFQVDVGGGVRDEVEEVKDFLLAGLHAHEYTEASGSIVTLFEGGQDDYDDENRVYVHHLTFTALDNNT